MVDEKNVEEIFDIFNQAAIFLFENLKMNYYDSMITFGKNVVDNSTIDIDPKLHNKYIRIVHKFKDSYNVEELRKGLNYVILNCFKEMGWTINSTPDVISLFFNYLVDKIYPKKKISILDPCIGTANLLLSITNTRTVKSVYGIDYDDVMIEISKMVCDFIEPVTLFYQDTLTVELENIDLIVSDLPNDVGFTYDFIAHHINTLKNDGHMILLIDNSFFSQENELKKYINDNSTMLGLIELPDSFFKNTKKSIIILKRSKEPIKNFLLAKMPNVNEASKMEEFLNKIDLWFVKNGGK